MKLLRVDSFSVSLVVASCAGIEVAPVVVSRGMVSTAGGVLSRVELGEYTALLVSSPLSNDVMERSD
jgi:C4-type Zn-finger protein